VLRNTLNSATSLPVYENTLLTSSNLYESA